MKLSIDKKTFTWSGLRYDGKQQSGEVAAPNLNAAKAYLQQQGILVYHLHKNKRLLRLTASTIHHKYITIFYRQLATLLKAGVALTQCLDILSQHQENLLLRKVILSLKNELEAGQTFSYCLRQHSNYFDALTCQLIFIAEESGTLETMLLRISHYNEQKRILHYQIKQALFYPIIVTLVAISISLILLIFVIPQFANLFATFNTELPFFTRQVMHLSQFIQHQFGYSLLLLPLIYCLHRYYKQQPTRQLQAHALFLKIPLLGAFIQKCIWARFARTLATLLYAGIPITSALKMLQNISKNKIIAMAIRTLEHAISDGMRLHQALRANRIFPPVMAQMIQVGEESGSLDHMLEKMAELYETETAHWIKTFSHLLEPLIIIILGVLIGGLVIAMYLPIFKLGTVI